MARPVNVPLPDCCHLTLPRWVQIDTIPNDGATWKVQSVARLLQVEYT